MRISDWSSDVCSPDLSRPNAPVAAAAGIAAHIDPAAAGISHKPLLPTASTTNHLKEGWEPPFRGGVKQKRRRSDDGPAPLSAVRKVVSSGNDPACTARWWRRRYRRPAFP